ncbi:MAG: hypothetical protein JWN62_3450 [Acidimicrobiales bacterium]|nr:hypothetical protein [Acidimicrobiales bacterium]
MRVRTNVTRAAGIAAIPLLLLACSSDTGTGSGSQSSTSSAVVANTSAASCGQTSAAADETVTFVFTHTSSAEGVDSKPGSSFAHVRGVAVQTDAANTQSIDVTISDTTGNTLATINGIGPGSTCGVDYDFPPGDYMIESSDGNGTQFTSFSDQPGETTATAASGASSEPAPSGASGHATLMFDGTTYDFTNGGCSPTLDPNLFVFRDPPTPGVDATYFALTVGDVTTPSSVGGKHAGSITYQKDGKTVVAASEATLDVGADLSGGTFTGVDFLTSKPVSGSYTC